MKRTRAEALVLVNWRGVFYRRYELDRHVTALEGSNGAGKTTVMIAAYVVLLPDMSRLRFTNLGETGATGGDKGIWGRLGELGRPSYAVMEFVLPRGERWVAGVHLERHSEPSVEPTPFIVTGLGSDVRLQDLLLLTRGDHELVPELHELRENATRLGGQLKVFTSARDYFATLFEHGVTPLRLGSDEERNKLNEMLKTSMTGGLSRALTSELRDFVLKEEGDLEDTLRQMRGHLDATRQTRTRVRESRQLEEEIGGVFLAGHTMFYAAYLATRERADELSRRVAEAEAAERAAFETKERAERELAQTEDELVVLERRREELQVAMRECEASRARLVDALAAQAEVERLVRVLGEAEEQWARALMRREEADNKRLEAKAEVQVTREDYERAAAGLSDHQRGLEELHRRAGAYHQVTRKLREAREALAPRQMELDGLQDLAQDVRAELERVDHERRETRARLADHDAFRARYARAMAALRGLVGMAEAEPYSMALEALRHYREAVTLAERLPSIERALDETRRLATRQKKARQQANELGLPPGCGQAEVGLALDEAEARRHEHESAERTARAESQRLQAKKTELEVERRALMKRDELWPRLDEIARRLGVVDRGALEQARKVLVDHQTTVRRREDAARAEGEAMLLEQRRLLSIAGPLSADLLVLKEKLDAEVISSFFEDASPDEAATWEARLGSLIDALVVDDPKSAARRIGARPETLQNVVLLSREVDIRSLVEPVETHEVRLSGGQESATDLVILEGATTRVSRVPTQPRLGRKARQQRAAELGAMAEKKAQEVVELRAQQRQLERMLSDSELLLVEQATWLAGDPRTSLGALRTELAALEATLVTTRADITHHVASAQKLAPRISALRVLLAEALLLDPPDHEAREKELADEQARARQAKARVSAQRDHARLLEEELGTLRTPPLSDSERDALERRHLMLNEIRARLDIGAEALDYVIAHRDALGWAEAPVQLAAKEALGDTLSGQVRDAARRREEAEVRLESADLDFERRSADFFDADGARRVAAAGHAAAEARLQAIGVYEPTTSRLAELVAELASLEAAIGEVEPRRDVLIGLRGARERALVESGQRLAESQTALTNERRDAEPALDRWDRLRRRADELGLTKGAAPDGLTEVRGTPNLHQLALTHRALLREKLARARGGDELAALVELKPEASTQEDGYLELWVTVRAWLHRRLPAQVAEVDDPREALTRFRDQLASLEEQLDRQEAELRGKSEDIASQIASHIRTAKRQIKSLNKNLAEIAFGSIAAIRIQTLPEDRMEAVLAALRDGAAQGTMFQADAPFEEALDEIFRRFGGGKAGGVRLLDYRQYLRLQVEVRRKSGTQWELANPTRLSTGEAIGVGAALMMVVLTEWERYATLLRGKKAHGSLRFLFLDEANRLSHDNLGVLFDLCQTLDLQLLIAAPEVARADGNTTYRLVRKVSPEGHEEVEVTGRRVVR